MAKISVIRLLMNNDCSLDKDRAGALVICRNVYVNGELCTDTKAVFDKDAIVEISYPKYVSRGGFKLEKALSEFKMDVTGKVVLDAGSSTGGFSDCLLQNGVSAVHCVDVGYNLLDYKIRNDSRTFVHEKQNIMTLDNLEPKPDFAVADLSFRSINGAASHILNLTKERLLVALIKPQFEVAKWQENFFGVVQDKNLMVQTMSNVYEALYDDNVGIYNATVSPIKGHKGNTEFLVLLKDRSEDCLSEDRFLNLLGINQQNNFGN